MSIDLTVIAIAFAFILLLIFFSAVVLYLSFRVKETFRKESKRGSNIVKIIFLIGALFLAGAIMYFSATTIATIQQNQATTNTPTPTATASPNPSTVPSPAINPTNTNPSSGPTTSPSPTPLLPQTSPTPTPNSATASFSVFFYPSPAAKTSPTAMTMSIINPSSATLRNAVIQTNTLFSFFSTTDSRVNVNAGTISLGDLPSGTTVITIQLQALKVGQLDDTLSLVYQSIQNPVIEQISIRIIGK
jgi:hypothetical protein